MHSGWDARLKTVFDVVVDAQARVDQILEVSDDLVRVFVVKPLQFGDVFKFIEELLEFSIEVKEHFEVVPQGLQQLTFRKFVRIGGSLLHLAKLLTESLVELWHLLLVIFGETSLLLDDHVGHFGKEVRLVRVHRFL